MSQEIIKLMLQGIEETFYMVAVATVIGGIIGIPLGLLMGLSEGLAAVLNPFVQFLRPLPKIALIPLAVVWLGIGEASKFFLIFIATFLSVVVGASAAVERIGRSRIRVAQTLGASRKQIFLRVVLPDGTETWLGNKCVKDVAGYSMKDLFVGSEGTLGLITEVMLKLVPRPKSRRTMLALYDSMEAAAETISAIIAARIIPCTLEFLDRVTVRCVEDYAKIGLPTDVEALVLMETDGHPVVVEEEASEMMALAKKHGAREVKAAADEDEGARLAAARRNAFSALARIRPTTILEDVTVPRSELAKMVAFINQVAQKHHLQVGTFGHLGDGNLHPTFLTNELDKDEMHRVELALEDIVDETIRLGGTVTGEHGVGVAKKAFVKKQLGEGSYELMRTIKRSLDPEGLFNPGKMFDLA